MTNPAAFAINLVEKGWVPDRLIRAAVRRLIAQRQHSLPDEVSAADSAMEEFVAMMDESPIALDTDKANEQHYELPAKFFELCLGEQNKYSCCYWPDGVTTLKQAETAALTATCEHADLQDGQSVLELGCGWGSLTLWMAQQFPASSITAVSNSQSQRRYIENEAAARGLKNVTVITQNMTAFETDAKFDRVVSVEMFEHMRNYRALFQRIANWLTDDGQFFMHIFCHRNSPYVFEDRGATDWMSRYFFSGGIMPAADLPLHFQGDLALSDRWQWNGKHYQQTSEAWLENMDRNREAIMEIFHQTYGAAQAGTWWVRWRLFYISVAELFGYDNGEEWYVTHYRFRRA